ncbi:DUF6527 family protein [Pseudomonas aeruginosa]|uniref:DUF6527 family protein n=1 Tax=Pseudomonas aeruginosa TaxID=287 RepID=UPI00093AC3F9|nr:DUF6527 family protein [Pseudomonas aeruginosa]ELP1305163.1 hypothetical protein [Pseudomonas aeruginosa]ELP1332911.1 hypothetical protein [Pseudomonas aeruginosa]MCO3228597.1 hypothetical protein [Pseudomonas aeruginosa]RMK72575.1 hypothetical protein IPC85_23860 [Pseudomonas aeruginosa]RMK81562.1 hypothetical protein IPC84_19860 [Pseudomonas aeruginosa]
MSAFIQLSPILERADDQLFFLCPGCQMLHGVNVNRGKPGPAWDWNGDVNQPTFSPSILVTFNWGVQREERRCHSFVREGRIEFLGDCTHRLVGQTVDLPPLGDNE